MPSEALHRAEFPIFDVFFWYSVRVESLLAVRLISRDVFVSLVEGYVIGSGPNADCSFGNAFELCVLGSKNKINLLSGENREPLSWINGGLLGDDTAASLTWLFAETRFVIILSVWVTIAVRIDSRPLTDVGGGRNR